MQTKKIKPLFFYPLTTNNEKDVRFCIKRRPKYGKSFTYNLGTDYETHERYINPITYLKISKHVKSVQELMLNRYSEYADSPCAHMRDHLCKISKNLSKVKTLFLEDSRFVPAHLAELLKICLRCSKQIKRIDTYISYYFYENDEFDEQLYGLYAGVFRKAKLQALNLYGRANKTPDLVALSQFRSSKIDYISYTSGSYAEEISFKPDNMRRIWIRCRCGETTTFEMCWKWENGEFQTPISLLLEIVELWTSNQTPQPRSSISELTNLIALQIDVPIKGEILKYILESFPNLSNMIGLKICESFSEEPEPLAEMNQLLTIPTNLTTLNLDLTKVGIPIQNLAGLLKENVIKKFYLNIPTQTKNDIENMISLAQTLKHIKILSIKIPSSKANLSHKRFDLLLNEISDLKSLIKIELIWTSSKIANRNKNASKKESLNILSASLETLLSKLHQLEDVKIHCILMNPDERYPLLKNIVQRAEGLRKLDIDVGAYLPNQVDFEQIGSLLKNLKKIEVLRLVGFEIAKDRDLLGLVKEVYYLRKLRKLKLGTVTKMTFGSLDAIQKSLFSFSTIEKFNLNASPDFIGLIPEYLEETERGSCQTRPGYVTFYRPYGTETEMEWRREEHDMYEFRRGQGTGRRGGRYHDRGKHRISWFREL